MSMRNSNTKHHTNTMVQRWGNVECVRMADLDDEVTMAKGRIRIKIADKNADYVKSKVNWSTFLWEIREDETQPVEDVSSKITPPESDSSIMTLGQGNQAIQ